MEEKILTAEPMQDVDNCEDIVADKTLTKKEKKAAKKALKAAAKLEKKNNKKRRRRWGDRKDGRKVRSLPPMQKMMPYIMKVRADAQNHFEDEIDITNIEKYLDEKHAEGHKSVGLLHIIITSYIRAMSQRPGINRFCSGQKVYARNNVIGVMTIKKEMSVSSPDTTIKVEFDKADTVLDVCEKFNSTVEKALSADSSFDNTAKKLSYIPGLLLRGTVAFLRFLDYFGWLPKKLLDVSPFHGSFIITSMGSLGINAIYHHLYDFGNLPVFMSYGKKYSKNVLKADGTVEKRDFISFRVVTDERICDGYYYASAFKMISRYLQHPEQLDVPPKEIVEDID